MSWSRELSRSLRLGELECLVRVRALRDPDGSLRFDTIWPLSRPVRMSADAIDAVDAFRIQAVRELVAELRAIGGTT